MNTASLILTMCLLAKVFTNLVAAQTIELPEAKVTVVVRDQDGKPVEGARVGFGGTMSGRPGTVVKGATDATGMFTAQLHSNGEVGITVRKTGYYDSLGPDYNFKNVPAAIERAFAKKRWEPWKGLRTRRAQSGPVQMSKAFAEKLTCSMLMNTTEAAVSRLSLFRSTNKVWGPLHTENPMHPHANTAPEC